LPQLRYFGRLLIGGEPLMFQRIAPEPVYPHSWASTARRFPQDQLLRRNNYVIHARPRDGEPGWERNGQTYTQAQALAEIGRARNEERRP
jgi:hypothetical protein